MTNNLFTTNSLDNETKELFKERFEDAVNNCISTMNASIKELDRMTNRREYVQEKRLALKITWTNRRRTWHMAFTRAGSYVTLKPTEFILYDCKDDVVFESVAYANKHPLWLFSEFNEVYR